MADTAVGPTKEQCNRLMTGSGLGGRAQHRHQYRRKAMAAFIGATLQLGAMFGVGRCDGIEKRA
jgi:hypothetical protein